MVTILFAQWLLSHCHTVTHIERWKIVCFGYLGLLGLWKYNKNDKSLYSFVLVRDLAFLYSACDFFHELGISFVYLWFNLFKTHCVLFASIHGRGRGKLYSIIYRILSWCARATWHTLTKDAFSKTRNFFFTTFFFNHIYRGLWGLEPPGIWRKKGEGEKGGREREESRSNFL